MNKTFFLINILFLVFLFGCGSDKSSPVIENPVAYFYKYNLEENSNPMSGIVSSSEFSSQNSIDLAGNIDLNFSTNPQKNYIQLNVSNGYIYNSILEGGLNYNDSHKVVFFNSKPFIFDNGIEDIQSIKEALDNIENNLSLCISQFETIKTSGNDIEKKISQNIIDLINIVNHYDIEVGNIDYSNYIASNVFMDGDLSPLEYYNGILYIIHSVFYDKTTEKLNISKRILENIRADEPDFIDNNAALFGVHSDDLKSIYILNCFLVDSYDYLKLRNFQNNSNTELGDRLIVFLEEVGFF